MCLKPQEEFSCEKQFFSEQMSVNTLALVHNKIISSSIDCDIYSIFDRCSIFPNGIFCMLQMSAVYFQMSARACTLTLLSKVCLPCVTFLIGSIMWRTKTKAMSSQQCRTCFPKCTDKSVCGGLELVELGGYCEGMVAFELLRTWPDSSTLA